MTREATVSFRRAMSGAWIWELLTSDGHVCNRSEEFQTQAEAKRDAVERGQTAADAEQGKP